jgi:hypothetical protein
MCRPPAPSAVLTTPTFSDQITINLGFGTWNVPATLEKPCLSYSIQTPMCGLKWGPVCRIGINRESRTS